MWRARRLSGSRFGSVSLWASISPLKVGPPIVAFSLDPFIRPLLQSMKHPLGEDNDKEAQARHDYS